MSKEAMKLALELATMHHTDDGYMELRSKVRAVCIEALALVNEVDQEQPAQQQEPVGKLKPCKEGWFADIDNPPPTDGVYETLDLYTYPPTLSLAQRIVLPDAITDDSESPEYRTGWNECREVMRGMLK